VNVPAIFYGSVSFVVLVWMSVIAISKFIKRQSRRLRDAEIYLMNRHFVERTISENWLEMDAYVQWVLERIESPELFGKHSKPVTVAELDELIGRCDVFLRIVTQAIASEHSAYRVLPRNSRYLLSRHVHAGWHNVQHKLRRARHELAMARWKVDYHAIR
jgi:hypothetical protein